MKGNLEKIPDLLDSIYKEVSGRKGRYLPGLNFSNFNQQAKQIIKILEDTPIYSSNIISNYRGSLEKFHIIIHRLGKYDNLSTSYVEDNPLQLILEGLTGFLLHGITRLTQLGDLEAKEDFVITSELAGKFHKLFDSFLKRLRTKQDFLDRNWKLECTISRIQEIINVLSDISYSGAKKAFETVDKDKISERILGIGELLKRTFSQIKKEWIIDIWCMKILAQHATHDRSALRELQTLIGEHRETRHLPVIYTAQETLHQVFINSTGEHADEIKATILGRVDAVRESEKQLPTLFYFSGKQARNPLSKFGQKASTIFRVGHEFSYRYIHAIADIEHQLKNRNFPVSQEVRAQFALLVKFIEKEAVEPKMYWNQVRNWFNKAQSDLVKIEPPRPEEVINLRPLFSPLPVNALVGFDSVDTELAGAEVLETKYGPQLSAHRPASPSVLSPFRHSSNQSLIWRSVSPRESKEIPKKLSSVVTSKIEELTKELSISIARRDNLQKKLMEGHSSGSLEKELEKTDEQIVRVETERATLLKELQDNNEQNGSRDSYIFG